MAHKKGAGSTKNGRDSNSKRLGIKIYGNQPTKAGAIIVNDALKEHCNTNAIVVKDVYLAYSILSHKFKQSQNADNLSF